MGSTSYCGDSAVRSGYETCDDGNTVTEACTYGQASCTVCDSTCHSIAGAISYCGDSVRQAAREACDNGASNSINGNCSPTCTTCDKVPGSEPVTYDDVAWTGGVSFTVTQATTLHQFKVYHHDVSYRLYLYQLAAPDTAPAVDALPVWVMPAIGLPFATPNAPTFDTIDVSLPLSAGTSYLLSTVGQVMVGTITNPATDYPAQSLSGIKVSKAFSVGDTLELNQGTFSTNFWGPFTDLRSCLQSPN
jgi:cysteine-rich repeat protein